MGIFHLFVNLKEYSNGISEEEKNKMEDKVKQWREDIGINNFPRRTLC